MIGYPPEYIDAAGKTELNPQAALAWRPHIDKPFCGTALIDKHYVRMAEFAKATDEGEPQCSSESFCTRVFRFYRDKEKATTPYILIFHGPRHRKSA